VVALQSRNRAIAGLETDNGGQMIRSDLMCDGTRRDAPASCNFTAPPGNAPRRDRGPQKKNDEANLKW